MTRAETTTIEIERRIAAPPEVVFSYFTDPVLYRRWQGVDAELDPRPGGTFRVTMTGQTGAVVRGVYLTIEPPERIVFSWGWEPRDGGLPRGAQEVPPGSSTVEITLVPDGTGTVLRVRHGGLPGEDSLRFHESGWTMTIGRLVIVGGGGDPGPNPLEEA